MSESGKRKRGGEGGRSHKKAKFYAAPSVLSFVKTLRRSKALEELKDCSFGLVRDIAGSACQQHPSVYLQNKATQLPLGTRGILISCQGGKETPASSEAVRAVTPVSTSCSQHSQQPETCKLW